MIDSAAAFQALAEDPEPRVRRRAVMEPAPEEVWLEIIFRSPELRADVVLNKALPVSVLAVLARDPDPRVRSMVARKRKATPELLQLLARDADSGVRLAVAYNPATPAHVLEELRNDGWDEIVRKAEERLRGA